MGGLESKGEGSRTCGECSDAANPFTELSCIRRGGSPRVMLTESEVSGVPRKAHSVNDHTYGKVAGVDGGVQAMDSPKFREHV